MGDFLGVTSEVVLAPLGVAAGLPPHGVHLSLQLVYLPRLGFLASLTISLPLFNTAAPTVTAAASTPKVTCHGSVRILRVYYNYIKKLYVHLLENWINLDQGWVILANPYHA